MLTGRRSTTQCNATSRIRYTVLFGINVQDTIKYLPFDMSGTVAESVTDATLLFTKTKKKLCKHIPEKCSIWCYTVKCHDYFSLFPALLEQKNSCFCLKNISYRRQKINSSIKVFIVQQLTRQRLVF